MGGYDKDGPIDDASAWACDCIVSLSIVSARDYPYKPDSKDLAQAIHTRDLEIDQLRARVAELEAERAELVNSLEAANDVAQDYFSTLEMVANALKVPREPHQGRDHRTLEAALDAMKDRERLDWLETADNGGYHCDILWHAIDSGTLEPDPEQEPPTIRQAIDAAREGE